jgi:transcriptional regulator with XRE-family HTH domain
MTKRITNINKVIGSKLKKARDYRGYSQSQFGKVVHLNQTHICKIETGERGLTIDNLIAFSKVLNVSPLYFLSDFEKDNQS